MSEHLESYVIAAMCLIAGGLIILGRNWFAMSLMDSFRGFKTDKTSEVVRRFWSIAMAVFGGVVILIGMGIALTAVI